LLDRTDAEDDLGEQPWAGTEFENAQRRRRGATKQVNDRDRTSARQGRFTSAVAAQAAASVLSLRSIGLGTSCSSSSGRALISDPTYRNAASPKTDREAGSARWATSPAGLLRRKSGPATSPCAGR
jgi:hypothetical protein